MKCCALGTKTQEKNLMAVLDTAIKYNKTIIWVLEETQKIYGYLPESVLQKVAQKMKTTTSEIYSVASFYAEFSFAPKGKYPISVCLGTACYVNGAQEIFDKICLTLGIREGECTKDGRFSIDQTRCIGCCGMAPVMTIGEDVYGNLKLEDVDKILASYGEK